MTSTSVVTTCDRCGCEIPKRLVDRISGDCLFTPFFGNMLTLRFADGKVFTVSRTDDLYSQLIKHAGLEHIRDSDDEMLQIESSVFRSTRTIDLCPKCRKAFIRFMKGPVDD